MALPQAGWHPYPPSTVKRGVGRRVPRCGETVSKHPRLLTADSLATVPWERQLKATQKRPVGADACLAGAPAKPHFGFVGRARRNGAGEVLAAGGDVAERNFFWRGQASRPAIRRAALAGAIPRHPLPLKGAPSKPSTAGSMGRGGAAK